MSAALLRAWAERDAAKDAWTAFIQEATQYQVEDDPVLAALAVPEDARTAEQAAVLAEFDDKRYRLLTAVREAERKVRVAAGHDRP